MKKIFSFFAAMMLFVSTVSATTIYCKMTQGWWTADGAAVAVHHWGGETAATTWPGVRMAPVEGAEGVWAYDVPADVEGLIFVRVNGGGDVADWGAKTKDLVIPTDGKNLFTITNGDATWGDPGCDGEWSVYGGGSNPGGGDNPGGGNPSTPNAYWYYKGYIDGGNLENEEAGYNVFQCGTASIDVEEAAYLFVIYQVKGVQGVQYMAASYVDNATHATLLTSGVEKLYVPAGSWTLYLYDNGDGTVELSYEELPGKTLIDGNCDNPGGGNPGGNQNEAVENTQVAAKAHKAIIDGRLVIIRGDKMFDATGRQL